MERHHGHDFSRVRVHADSQSAQAARAVGAQAFTVGHDIVFGSARYEPTSERGFPLIAHELSHVVQHDARGTPGTAGVGPNDDPAERQAEQWAERATRRHLSFAAGSGDGERPEADSVGVRKETAAPARGHELMRQEEAQAAQPDYAWLASEVYHAMKGLGTDEERVYRALQQLRRDPDRIRMFREAYRKHGNLDADLEDDFSGEELEFAKQLLNMGAPGSPQEVVTGKASRTDLPEMARRLKRAVEPMGTDEEAVFAQLVRLDHDPELIAAFEAEYRRVNNGEDLRITLDDEMSDTELEYAEFLISVPFEYWVRRANEKLRRLDFGIPWGEVCGRDPKDARWKDAYDQRYWDQVDDEVTGCKLVLKSSVRPSLAVDALVEEQDRWKVDCAVFVQLAHWYALLHRDGPARFDARMGRPFELKKEGSTGVRTVVTFQAESRGARMRRFVRQGGKMVRQEGAEDIAPEVALANAPVGSRVMWTNLLVLKLIAPEYEDQRAFLNENTVKLGKDRYGAFPLRSGGGFVMREREIVERMAEKTASALNMTPAAVMEHIFVSEIEIIESDRPRH